MDIFSLKLFNVRLYYHDNELIHGHTYTIHSIALSCGWQVGQSVIYYTDGYGNQYAGDKILVRKDIRGSWNHASIIEKYGVVLKDY